MFAKARKRQPAVDWYWAASPEDRKEYDAFGPWVDVVRSEAEMPPRFRAAYTEHRGARFLLKVPIAADRLQVRPGTNLYRMILAVHDDRISLLDFAEGAIVTRNVRWPEIAAIRSMTNLLLANWTLLLKDGSSVTVDYNAVSSRRFDELTDFVRGKLVPRVPASEPAPGGATVAIADYFFNGMLSMLRHGGTPAVPIHFEPRDRPCRDEANRYRLSTGLLVLDAGDELVIVDRGAAVRRYFHPTYAARVSFIPYRALSGFSLAAPPADARRFRALSLAMERQVIAQPCLTAPDRVAGCLAAHSVRDAAA